jgi:hypothetical protein
VGKVNPKQLTRGVKLLPEHIYDPLVGTMNQIVSGSILTSQMEEPRAASTIYLNIPDFDVEQKEVSVPLVFPQPQELFTLSPSNFTLKRYKLETIGLSFDTRAEAAGITAKSYPPPGGQNIGSGKINVDGAELLTIRMTIVEREIKTGATLQDDTKEYNTVFTKTFDPGLFTAASRRANPITIDVEDVKLSHDKVYIVILDAPDFDSSDNDKSLALVNLTMTLKISSELMRHDSESLNDQNYPPGFKPPGWPTDLSFPQDPNLITPAPDNAIIAADVAAEYTPVQSAIELIDDKIRHKLKAGFNKYSEPPRNPLSSFVQNDSGWCVMAVPCWGNLGTAVNSANKANGLPGHMNSGNSEGGLNPPFHRSIIPIEHPMVVHHVVAAHNYTNDEITAPVRPSGPTWGTTLTMDVGVAVSAGGKGDSLAYQQVAYGSFRPDGNDPSLFSSHILRFTDEFIFKTHNWDLYSIPIIGAGTSGNPTPETRLNGQGYIAQGCPFYIGQSRSGGTTYHDSDNRSLVARNTGAGTQTSRVEGAENFIEVRWRISYPSPSTGDQQLFTDIFSDGGEGTTLIGRYGCWVYIIGKKILC